MEIICNICNAKCKFEIGFDNIRLYRCFNCDHCFTDITSIDGLEYYEIEYYEIEHKNWFTNPNIFLFDQISNFISCKNSEASVIDVGCGKGDFLRFLHKKYPALSLTGIDLSPNTPIEGIKFIEGDISNINFAKQYDFVISLAVIEHVKDIKSFINKLYNLCLPNGHIIIMTINDRSILYEVARFLNRFGYSTAFKRLYSKHHLNHFNVSSLNKLVENSGLKEVRTLYHNIPLSAVDIPPTSALTGYILKSGVWGTFLLGSLTNRTFLQTIICQKYL